MKPPIVIACGNRLRQDDGVGCRAAELLERKIPQRSAAIVQTHQLTPELMAEISGASAVIFLDAAMDLEPGTVVTKRISADHQTVWSHDYTPPQLLALARSMGEAELPAFQITGGIGEIGFGENLTAAGERVAARLAEAALQLLNDLRRPAGVCRSACAPHPASRIPR